ncbi:MAG: hypothetical protein JNL82_05230 [Myxococcales bacterium]|nr:hypothetical protein [Myxococcales bacterium]
MSLLVALALAIPPPAGPVASGRTRLAPVDVGDPAGLAPPMTPAVTAAQRLADGGRHGEAAAAFAALWRDSGDPTLLYQAARAHARAGQNAAAARLFQAWLDRGAGSVAERAHVEARRAAAQAATVRVRITASEAIPAGRRPVAADLLARAALRLEPVTAGGATDPGAVLSLANYQGEEVAVDRVPHVVHLAIPGFMPVSLLRSGSGADETWDIPVARVKVPVELRFAPEKAVRGARLQVTPNDGALAVAVEQTLEAPAMTLMLVSGDWQVHVTSRRHEAHTGMTVTPGMRPVQVLLARKGGGGGGDREFRRNDVQAAVFGGVFVATLLTGLGVSLAGTIKQSKARRRNEEALQAAVASSSDGAGEATARELVEDSYATAAYHHDLRRSYDLTTAGGVVALSSVGALLAGLTVQSRAKRTAAYAEMGLGALFVAGGGAWLGFSLRQQDDLLGPGEPEDRATAAGLRSLGGQRAGATIMLGLGAGLALFPALALVGDAVIKRRDRRRGYSALPHRSRSVVAPSFGRDHVGLAIRGQF